MTRIRKDNTRATIRSLAEDFPSLSLSQIGDMAAKALDRKTPFRRQHVRYYLDPHNDNHRKSTGEVNQV